MGKNKKEFPSQNPDKNHNEKFNDEKMMKNSEDTSINNKNSNKISLDLKTIYEFNHEHNIFKEKFKNKFNIKLPEMNGNNLNFFQSKEPIENTSDSFLKEDYYGNFSYFSHNNNCTIKQNKFDNQQRAKEKTQGQFKSTAADFKIKYKTELCKYYEINGYCKFGDRCAYAHGKENLRSKVTNSSAYRTKKCFQFFEQGYCPYGSRCQFAHQLTTNIINNPYDRKMSYTKTLETISKLENVENIKKLISKPRLTIFKEIYDNEISIENCLLDDIKSIHKDEILERIDVNNL